MLDQLKSCSRCETTKSLTEFYINKSGKRAGTASAYCKPCQSEWQKERRRKDPSIYRRFDWPSKLKSYYGITVSDYERMLAAQNGCCAICHSSSPKARKYRRVTTPVFCVDHCHKTGRVRGLLCTACNRAIGLLDDNHENALALAQYLIKSKSQ